MKLMKNIMVVIVSAIIMAVGVAVGTIGIFASASGVATYVGAAMAVGGFIVVGLGRLVLERGLK